LLICRRAAISLSAAAGYVSACMLDRHADEAVIVQQLRIVSPRAWPNSLMICVADRHMGREGRMIGAIDGSGAGDIGVENETFLLPSRGP
jgi:predicted protein tyrosine phosphatase